MIETKVLAKLQITAGWRVVGRQKGTSIRYFYKLFNFEIDFSLPYVWRRFTNIKHCKPDNLFKNIHSINTELISIVTWCEQHGLQINPSKSQVMFMCSQYLLSEIDWGELPAVFVSGVKLGFSEEVKNLFDQNLSWSIKKCNKGMFQFLLVGVLVICLTWLYLRWSRAKQYWAKKGVPYASPHPILGSLTFLQKENPSLWMINMYQRFRRSSPYVGIWWFWRPVLLVNSPDLARNILLRDSACFRDRFTRSGASDPVGSLNLFTIKEPHWTPIRRHLTSIFTASKLKGLQNLYDLKTTQLLQRIKTTEDNTKLGLRTLFTDFTTDIIGTAAFGVETNATLTGEDPIRVVTKGFMYMNIFRGICWSCVFFLPECMDIFRFHLFPKSATDYFRKIVGIVSKQRKVENRNPTNPKDLLDALLSLKDAKDIRTNATDEDIVIAQASIFLLGGFETSGSALTFVTYELSFKPEIQEKLYEELIKLKNSSEDGTLDISKLMELEYLNCVVKEVLRKYAPMGWLDRIAARDYQIDDKLTIPAGTPVYVNAIGMHYDEDYFPDPEKFDPDRFLPENEKNIKPYTYMPFGEGPRACVGKRFGLITVRHALSHLVLNYKFQSLPDAPKPNEVELEKYGILMTPFNDVYIKFVPRH